MSLKEILAQAHGVTAPPPLDRDRIYAPYFTPKHIAWMERPERDRQFTPRALEHCRKALAGEYAALAPRKGRLSPSAVGTDCERELLFSFVQAPQQPVKPRNQEVMDAGTFEHIRLQMVGLSAGYLTDVEMFLLDEDLSCGGSADGVGDDMSLWELKNTAGHLFDPISKGPDFLAGALERERLGTGSPAAYAAKMVIKHKIQMRMYKWLDAKIAEKTGRPPIFGDRGSLVYMHRQDKKFYEIRIDITKGHDAVEAIVESAKGWIDINQLPDRLIGCEAVMAGGGTDKEKRRHDSCYYRDHCRIVSGALFDDLV